MHLRKLAAAALTSLALGCIPCNSIACDAGFLLELVGEAGLPEGSYSLDLNLEGKPYNGTCVVGSLTGPSACSFAEGMGPFTVDASVILEGDAPRIVVRMVDQSESEGNFLAYRGPKSVEVKVFYETNEVAAAAYEPKYERVDHRGSAECGYCDEAERVELGVSP